MAYDDVDSLYTFLLLWTTGVVFLAAAGLSLTHVLALRDRPVVPRGIQRIAGWLVTGLIIGLATLQASSPATTARSSTSSRSSCSSGSPQRGWPSRMRGR